MKSKGTLEDEREGECRIFCMFTQPDGTYRATTGDNVFVKDLIEGTFEDVITAMIDKYESVTGEKFRGKEE